MQELFFYLALAGALYCAYQAGRATERERHERTPQIEPDEDNWTRRDYLLALAAAQEARVPQ